jgi:hypothetical protein
MRLARIAAVLADGLWISVVWDVAEVRIDRAVTKIRSQPLAGP